MSFKLILNLISFTILVWLLVSSSLQISIAATKSRYLMNVEKKSINNLIIQIALLFSTPKARHHEFNSPL